MKWSNEEVDAINERWREAYIRMMEKMHAAHDELAETHTKMLQAKTAGEIEHDRLLRHIRELFADHPNFAKLVDAGYYDQPPYEPAD